MHAGTLSLKGTAFPLLFVISLRYCNGNIKLFTYKYYYSNTITIFVVQETKFPHTVENLVVSEPHRMQIKDK